MHTKVLVCPNKGNETVEIKSRTVLRFRCSLSAAAQGGIHFSTVAHEIYSVCEPHVVELFVCSVATHILFFCFALNRLNSS